MTTCEWTKDDHIAHLWLNNPEKQNALGLDLFTKLPVLMDQINADEQVRVVVLAARGKNFTVGLDLKGGMGEDFANYLAGGMASQRNKFYHDIKRLQAACNVFAQSPKPVIAAVHGWCIGGGLDMISACDLRYAVKGAKLSLRETRIAMVADLGSLQRLPGILPEGVVRELAFSGRDFDASEGKQLGLFNEVYSTQKELMQAVSQKAHEIAANSPLAVQGAKHMLNLRRERHITQDMDYVALWNASHFASEDLMEAMAAFVQKRAPKFQGR